jgi:UDP-N-acetylmuramate-alanine ligase
VAELRVVEHNGSPKATQNETAWRVSNPTLSRAGNHFFVSQPDGELTRISMNLFGSHNVTNASLAFAALHYAGLRSEDIAEALGGFQLPNRRLSPSGMIGQILLIDDFAHNPVQLSAVREAIAQQYPYRKCHVIFEPRQIKRTRRYLLELGGALATFSSVFVLPVSRGLGDDQFDKEEGLDAALAVQVRQLGTPAYCLAETATVRGYVEGLDQDSVLLTSGTSNPLKYLEAMMMERRSFESRELS